MSCNKKTNSKPLTSVKDVKNGKKTFDIGLDLTNCTGLFYIKNNFGAIVKEIVLIKIDNSFVIEDFTETLKIGNYSWELTIVKNNENILKIDGIWQVNHCNGN